MSECNDHIMVEAVVIPKLENLKLYVRHVFISDELKELIPKYIGFLLGIIDSATFPLNVS